MCFCFAITCSPEEQGGFVGQERGEELLQYVLGHIAPSNVPPAASKERKRAREKFAGTVTCTGDMGV
jgi:hypothetical protein